MVMNATRTRAVIFTLICGLVSAGAVGSVNASAANKDTFSKTKTVTREFDNGSSVDVVDSRDVTVRVDHTQNLRGRERVHIDWSGARPSAGRASDPYGENGLSQEYPVVVMQCRGLDDSTLSPAKQLSPKTCWTSTRQQRSQTATTRQAIWRHDLYATDADKAQKSGLDPFPDNTTCTDVASFSTHLTPFEAAGGKAYPACSGDTMPPESAVGAAFPPAELSAFTDLQGKGAVNFEVRSKTENESLGCSDKVACSIVVIPIMGLSCVDADRECRKAGRMSAGSSNFANDGVDAAVSPVYWWSASNWRNRISVPLSFGLAPDACDVLDKRPPTAFYGSELMSQAALQWSPAYCLRKDRFKFQHNRLPDDAAFVLMEKGEAAAAFVSGNRERSTDAPVGYAPTAVTGFEVSYIVDKPDNAGEVNNLKLNARLIAKLLTQSYPGSSLGAQHPGMANNPLSINLDPEFKALNPRLDSISREAAATVLSLSGSSDVIKTLGEYMVNDPEAKAFIAGDSDPWGMVINPTYKALRLPLDEWPLLDTFVPTTALECQKQNPAAYLGQIAAPVNSLRKIAEAVLDAWPNVQTKCDRASSSDPFKVGRVERQGIGSRMMLGITSMGDAERFGLHAAGLQTKSTVPIDAKFTSAAGRTFIEPTNASVQAAIESAKSLGASRAFAISQADLRKSPKAYPGSMIVYTAARLSGMSRADASKVASFIRISTTEGQKPGSGNGQLPDGYVPILKSGTTAPLFAAAQRVANEIEAQGGLPGSRGPSNTGAAVAPGVDAAAADNGTGKTSPTTPVNDPDQMALTAAHNSAPAGVMLPLIVIIALIAGLLSPATRIIARGRRR